MELKKLVYLDAVYRLRNFSKAASEQYISQPSISNAIQSLEEELGVVLIRRNTRPLVFTPAGEELIKYTKRILQEVQEATREMQSFADRNQKTLHIAVYSSATSQVIQKIYIDFHNLYPQYEICVLEDTLTGMMEKLLSGELDMAYALLPDHCDSRVFTTVPIELCELQVLLSAQNPLAEEKSISLAQLVSECVYSYPIGSYIRYRLDQELDRQHLFLKQLVPHRAGIVDSIVEQNQGISFTLRDSYFAIHPGSSLVVRPLAAPIRFQTGLIYKKDMYMTDAMKAMQAYLKGR